MRRRTIMTAAASLVAVLLGTAYTFALLIAPSAGLGGDKQKETKLKEPTAAQKKDFEVAQKTNRRFFQPPL